MSVLQKRIDAYPWDHRDFRVEEIRLNRVELDELRTRLDSLLEEERVLDEHYLEEPHEMGTIASDGTTTVASGPDAETLILEGD